MANHAEYPMSGSGILQVPGLLLTIATLETVLTENLITRDDCSMFNIMTAHRTTIRAVVANE